MIIAEKAKSFTNQYGVSILRAFGQASNGIITHAELNARYSKVVKLEKEMLLVFCQTLYDILTFDYFVLSTNLPTFP